MSNIDPTKTVVLGSRVYYKDNGPEDKGTVINIVLDSNPFVVKWDNSKHEDEKLDQFSGEQLEFVIES